MKIFIVHIYQNLCANNSDGKMWIVAENAEIAKIIAKQHTNKPIIGIDEFEVENEVIFSTVEIRFNYKMKMMTDNYGDLGKNYYYSIHPHTKRY